MSAANPLPTLTGTPGADALARCAYDVFSSWNPGHSAEFRQMIVLVGIVYAILALSAAIVLRRRFGVAAIVVISLAFALGAVLWSRAHPPIARLTGAIRIIENGTAQTDHWIIFTSPVDAEGALDWIDGAAPIFPEDSPAPRVSLEHDAAGRPTRFRFKLRAGEKLAFVTRTVAPATGSTLRDVRDQAFAELARKCYLREGFSVVGQNGAVIIVSK